jgi:phosphonate transport system ATP-binding protein
VQVQLNTLSARHPAAATQSDAIVGDGLAIRGLSLTIAAGEQVAVIGPSGAGKTTLLHAVACALESASGDLSLGGQNPWQLSRSALHELRGQLFLAPQVPPLPPRQRVVTAVLAGRLPQQGLWASMKSLFAPTDLPLAHKSLCSFDMCEKVFHRVDRLSGGERQRVGLARLLAADAKLWLIDEPLSALDPMRSTQAIAALTSEAKARNATLICTLHQVERALASFPRIIGLRDGSLAFDLPAAAVTQEHLSALYAHHEDELYASAANEVALSDVASAQPRVMHCR